MIIPDGINNPAEMNREFIYIIVSQILSCIVPPWRVIKIWWSNKFYQLGMKVLKFIVSYVVDIGLLPDTTPDTTKSSFENFILPNLLNDVT